MNYVIEISYDGSKFFGFQRLNEEVSVQKVIEEALTKINKQNVEVKGAGRTDRGGSVPGKGRCLCQGNGRKVWSEGPGHHRDGACRPLRRYCQRGRLFPQAHHHEK